MGWVGVVKWIVLEYMVETQHAEGKHDGSRNKSRKSSRSPGRTI